MTGFRAELMAAYFIVVRRMKKAYAKVYGGYQELVGGKIRECLSDLTGGITEEWDLKAMNKPKKNSGIDVDVKNQKELYIRLRDGSRH
ncbi:hypothetical protein niasHT_010742 [Heterodera trifolii]|uniref:Calpain catalytic domain-containing protein n=1 Tax=Heterodera trifolii TaxID=157864 RepID=A0ABD2LDW2_9BILA